MKYTQNTCAKNIQEQCQKGSDPKVGLEAESSVESDETTSDTPSHTFISRKLQKASPKRPESAKIRPDATSLK